jgi:hypothetical protein
MSRILYTIGRFDADAGILAAGLKSLGPVLSPRDLEVEKRYIEALGAAMYASMSQLSWKMTFSAVSSELILRDEKDRIRGEFALSPLDKLKPRDPQGYPYGMQEPDEDRISCVDLYSPNNSRVFRETVASLRGLKGSSDSPGDISGFTQWVNEEWVKGNSIPYLKLVWVEWFYIPFLSLPGFGLRLNGWKYIPADKSNLTSSAQFVQRFETRPLASDSSSDHVRKMFHDIFIMLQQRYGSNPNDKSPKG